MDEHVAIAIQERANIKEVTELRKEVLLDSESWGLNLGMMIHTLW